MDLEKNLKIKNKFLFLVQLSLSSYEILKKHNYAL